MYQRMKILKDNNQTLESSKHGTQDREIRKRRICTNKAYFALSHISAFKSVQPNVKTSMYGMLRKLGY